MSLDCFDLRVSIAEIFILCQCNPVALTYQSNPVLIRCVDWKMIVVDFYSNAYRT